MNTDGTLDPRLLLSGNSPQPAPNILSVQGALEMAARAREDTQVKYKPKSHGIVAKRICNRCGKTGHTAIELGDDGQYKCSIRRYETLIPTAQLQLLRARASAELETLKEDQSNSTPSTISSHESTATSSLPVDPFNRNWRIYPLIEPRKWNQPLPPKKREHYIEYQQRANEQKRIWTANYFEMYAEMQKGGSWRRYPYLAGSLRMARLHAANLKLIRAANEKRRAELETMDREIEK